MRNAQLEWAAKKSVNAQYCDGNFKNFLCNNKQQLQVKQSFHLQIEKEKRKEQTKTKMQAEKVMDTLCKSGGNKL